MKGDVWLVPDQTKTPGPKPKDGPVATDDSRPFRLVLVDGPVAYGGGGLVDESSKEVDPPKEGDTSVLSDQDCTKHYSAEDSGCQRFKDPAGNPTNGSERTTREAFNMCQDAPGKKCKVTYARVKRWVIYSDDHCQKVLFHQDSFGWVCK